MRIAGLLFLALAIAAPATASPRLLVGVTEDGLEYEPGAVRRDATAVGLRAVRITLAWRSGQTEPSADEREQLERATSGAGTLRVVLSVFGEHAADAPQTADARDAYCEFLRSIVARYPRIRDVVVWNEPNKSFFWEPQFDAEGRSAAPAAYEALLARCWDVLHAEREDVNVLGPSTSPRGNDRPDAKSNISHSPVRFFRELGRAYHASGREQPIFDTVAHHVQGASPSEPPWRTHTGGTMAEGDYERLVATLQRAFRGTAQPVPGRCIGERCVPLWYLEAGFETTPPPGKTDDYTGEEVVDTISAQEQARLLRRALEIAYCQPYVERFFNFLLWDEPRLEGWQSGLYWADRTEKPSATTVRDFGKRRIRCARVRRELPQADAVLGPPQVAAPPATNTINARDRDSGGGGLNARVIFPGAIFLVLLGLALIALVKRRSRIRARRNSR